MNKSLFFLIVSTLSCLVCQAQKPSDFLPDKPGKWSYSTNIKTPGAEVVALNKNLTAMAEWFHQNTLLLKNPAGYDLHAVSYGISNDDYKKNAANYGLRSEMVFAFQLFLSDLSRGGKWTVEPPEYTFYLNNTETLHGTNPNFPGWDNTKDPESLEKPMDKLDVQPILEDQEKENGGKLMRFNPDYRDRSLSPSAIQFA